MREQQTLGRRIQEARKAAGLSQESLGERLGVSRQAVSKWEADAAVPELENLIAMSRIFGVTIGALLGVEPEAAEDRSEKDAPEAPGEGVEGTAPAGELTDRELAAVSAPPVCFVVLFHTFHRILHFLLLFYRKAVPIWLRSPP